MNFRRMRITLVQFGMDIFRIILRWKWGKLSQYVENLILEVKTEKYGNFNTNKDFMNRKNNQNEEETIVTYGKLMCTDKYHKEYPI